MNRNLLTVAVILFVIAPAAGEQISFHEAVMLALKNAKAISMARADRDKAEHGYREARDAYIPQLTLGSGAAYTFGFPLGAPSVFNVTSYSMLFNPAQREYMRAGRFEIISSERALEDKRQQTILDTAVSYADLDRNLAALDALKAEESAADRAVNITAQRVQQGVEPEIENTRTELNLRKIRLKQRQVEGNVQLLQMRLSQLTGLPAAGLATIHDSMPELPPPPVEDLSTVAANQNPALGAAQNDALAKDRLAQAERKQVYPQVNVAGQYALFSRFNNYDEFYRRFTRNNGVIGVEIKIPILNRPQHQKYLEAKDDAQKARDQAADAKDQLVSETTKLQLVTQQADEARQIAELEYKLAQNDTGTVRTKMDAGQASPKDLENANIAEQDKRNALLDATFDYQQARLELLRATGDIEGWAKAGGAPAP